MIISILVEAFKKQNSIIGMSDAKFVMNNIYKNDSNLKTENGHSHLFSVKFEVNFIII